MGNKLNLWDPELFVDPWFFGQSLALLLYTASTHHN